MPGHDPVPLAVAKTLTGQPYSIGVCVSPARAGQRDYALVKMIARRLMLCAAALLAAACARTVDGTAVPALGAGPSLAGVDVDRVLLDQSRMQAITGADEHLTIIPSMDGKSPVDIDTLAKIAPPECRFVYADTATFGPDIEAFHKTTFQYPPRGGLISEGAAAYRDAGAAPQAFDALVATGPQLRDELRRTGIRRRLERRRPVAGDPARRLRPQLPAKAAVLVEVTFCGFPESVPALVITNIAANVPG